MTGVTIIHRLVLVLSAASAAAAAAAIHETDPAVSGRVEEYDAGRIIDITHAYHEMLPYGAGPIGTFVRLTKSMADGDELNLSELRLNCHAGTHVDAPGHVFQHYYDAGFDVDSLDLATLNGPALLLDVPRDKNITAEVMESLYIPKGVRRVIFRTLNTDRKLMYKSQFVWDFVGFTKDGAQWLVKNTDIKFVGIDYASVAAFDYLLPAHWVLLEAKDIIVVEALKLENAEPGIYSLHCLPLRLPGAEGSPIRCILIK